MEAGDSWAPGRALADGGPGVPERPSETVLKLEVEVEVVVESEPILYFVSYLWSRDDWTPPTARPWPAHLP